MAKCCSCKDRVGLTVAQCKCCQLTFLFCDDCLSNSVACPNSNEDCNQDVWSHSVELVGRVELGFQNYKFWTSPPEAPSHGLASEQALLPGENVTPDETVTNNVMHYPTVAGSALLEPCWNPQCWQEQACADHDPGFTNQTMLPMMYAPEEVNYDYTHATSAHLADWLNLYYRECIRRVPDSREGRKSKALQTFELVPGAQLPMWHKHWFGNFFEFVCKNASELALEKRIDKETPSHGSRILQKAIVLAQVPERKRLINCLERDIQRLLFHEGACFVISQVLYEALVAGRKPDQYFDFVHEFMLKATDEYHRNSVQELMTDIHSNHWYKMWIRLMSAGDRAHWKVLQSIVNHVEGDILQLVRHRQGVRCVNALIEHFLSFDAPKVASIRRALVREEEALFNLICHDFANHTIQLIAEYETEAIAKAIKKNFVVIAVSEFGNFVMSKCISADAYTDHINDFSELFESNSEEILRINRNAHTGTGKPPPGGRNQCLTCFLLAVWQSEQMHWRAADWLVGWVASWDGWVGLAALAELARVRAGWRAGRAVQGEIDPRGITHDSELPPVRIDRRLKEWSHPAVRLHAVQEDCGFLQHHTFLGRSRRHSRTIAPSPKRRWDKPSGQNFASYDELYQSVLPLRKELWTDDPSIHEQLPR